MAKGASRAVEKWMSYEIHFSIFSSTFDLLRAYRSRETAISVSFSASSPRFWQGGSVYAEKGAERFPSIISLR